MKMADNLGTLVATLKIFQKILYKIEQSPFERFLNSIL